MVEVSCLSRLLDWMGKNITLQICRKWSLLGTALTLLERLLKFRPPPFFGEGEGGEEQRERERESLT